MQEEATVRQLYYSLCVRSFSKNMWCSAAHAANFWNILQLTTAISTNQCLRFFEIIHVRMCEVYTVGDTVDERALFGPKMRRSRSKCLKSDRRYSSHDRKERRTLCDLDWPVGRDVLGQDEIAAVAQSAGPQLHTDDAEDEEDEEAQHQHVAEHRKRVQQQHHQYT